jgi:hypothetical protein
VLVPQAIAPTCRLCVVIPARDEAPSVYAALARLARQVDRRGRPVDVERYEVVVLANNCRDATAAEVARCRRSYPALALHLVERDLAEAEASVGHARRLLMDEAAARLADVPGAVIATSDADTRVSSTWVADTLAAIDRGVDLVAGRIHLDPADLRRLPPDVVAASAARDAYERALAWAEDHLDPLPWDRWPRHRQQFGASLALTVAAYRQVGGLPHVTEQEDVALVRAVAQHDLRVRHSLRVRVWTSGRTAGRAATGLAALLARTPTAELVEAPARTLTRLRRQRRLRACWRAQVREDARARDRLDREAAALDLTPRELLARFAAARTFGRLCEDVLLHALPVVVDTPLAGATRGLLAGLRPPATAVG